MLGDLPRVPAGLARPAGAEDACSTRLERREVSLVEVDTPTASPVRAEPAVRLHRHLHVRGRRAARRAARRGAGARPRPAARAARRGGAARADRPRRAGLGGGGPPAPERRARSPATPTRLHDLLRTLGDLSDAELSVRVVPGHRRAVAWRRGSSTERRAVKVRIGGEQRWIAAQDAGLYRDAVGAMPPGGLPEAFLEPVERARWRGCCAATRARTARSPPPRSRRGTGSREERDRGALAALERADELVRGEIRPDGARQRARVVRPRRAAPPAPREHRRAAPGDRADRPGDACSASRSRWHGIDRYRGPSGEAAGDGRLADGERRMPLERRARDRLREVLAPLQGLALTPEVWERDVLPRRLGRYDPRLARPRCARPARSCGSARAPAAGAAGAWRSTSARTHRSSGRRATRGDGPRGRAARCAARAARREARPSGRTCSPTSTRRRPTCATRCGTWSGRVRSPTTPSRRCARGACRWRRRRSPARPPAAGSVRAAPAPSRSVQGRWSLTAQPVRAAPGREGARSGARRAAARAPRHRDARDRRRREGCPAGSPRCTRSCAALETLGAARRGYFVEGLGGAQFALAGGGRAAAHAPRGARARRSCWPHRTRPTCTARRCRGRAATGSRGAAPRRPACPARTWSCSSGRAGALRRGRRPRARVAGADRPGGVAAAGARGAGRLRPLRAVPCGGSRSSGSTASR